MGSAKAAAKAGAVTSLYFAGSITALNALILLAFKSQAISALATISSCSGTGPATQTGTTAYCYSELFTSSLPFFFLQLVVIALFFAVAYGIFFEFLPGGFSYGRKSLLMSLIMLIAVLFTISPVVGDVGELVIVTLGEVVLAIVTGLVLARLYRRFTREVEFQTSDPTVKILVGKRDWTGKKKTFALGSSQSVEAVGEGGKTFKSWSVSGGVTVDNSRDPTTSIHVNGDGLLKVAAN